MKTFRIIGFAMLAILLSLSACSGGGDEPVDPTPKPEVSKSEITMDATLVSNGLSFGSTEGDQTVSFTASENWTLSVASTPSGATWCKASATSGSKGTASVKFTVEANTGYEDRMVSVTIKSGTASKTFTITQKGADALLVTTSKYEIPQSGGQIEVEVKSNLNYQLAVSEDAKSWITEGSGRSLTTRKHSFTISPNEEVDKREGTITFKSGDKSEVVRVYQSGGAIILLSQDEYTVSSEGDTLSVDVKSNVDYGVELPDVDWITDISSSRGMSSHTLEYVVHSNSTYDSRSAFIVFYDRNSDLKDTLTVHQQGIPFDTDYVDLQFDQPGVTTSYNETDGSLSMTYSSGYLPTVTPGNSIVLPAEFHFDIRVIESVSVSGNTLRLTTSQGNMTNLFRNTSFTLTTDASVTSRSAGSTVYTPTAYGYINEKGEYVEMYNESTSSRSSLSVEQDLWGFNENFNDEVIYSGKAGTLSWEKCEFYAGLKGTFMFDFGQKEVQDRLPVGDLKKFSYELNGTVGMDLMLKYDYAYEYEEEDDQIIKYNVIPTGVLRFTVGPVPVVILVYTHLGKQYACQIEGELEATTGVKLENEVSLGLEWTPGSGVVPTKSIKPTFEFHPLTVEAKASAEAKVSYYPQVEIGIYKFLGPWFEPRPYLKETVGAGFRASTDGDNYVGWKAETYNGMDLRMGLKMDFGFWDKEVWTSDLYNWIGDRLLFEAPSRIRTLSPENHIKVEKDESVTAEFMVESFSPITNKYYPCPWALINFEPESGNLDQPLAVTNLEGKATVAWTPDPGSSAQSRATETVDRKLTAKVVDKDGKTIDDTNLFVKTENDEDELRKALIKLYESTNGDNWTRNDNWCSDKPLTEWYGVSYGFFFEGFTISLSKNNLTGKINQTFLGNIMVRLNVSYNNLTSINLSGSTSLISLGADSNQLTSIDLSECIALESLGCEKNQLSFINLSKCTSLEIFMPRMTCPYSLDVSGCTALKTLDCLDSKLTYFDASGCTALEKIICSRTQLTSLDITGCTALKELFCSSTQLTSLDVTGCTALKTLDCSYNRLTSLNVSGCAALTSLNCIQNWPLSNINVAGCTALTRLDCYRTQITKMIPDWFSQITNFNYEKRYQYSKFTGTYTDKGYGWWYPGEPEKGYHGK